MSLLNNGTLANLTTPYYALATESGRNWYTFPSENGTVQLVDASGTQILRSIDGDLYYNNELLAKANDIQDIADWSLYPALSTLEMANQDITQVNSITTSTLGATSITATGTVQAGTLATVAAPYVPGDVKTATVTASGLVSAGSVSSSGNVQGASLTTTGGLDMANTAIARASAINLNNSGFAPYGQLTSPDGASLLWNGTTINTGAAGNASQWANFPAVAPIQGNTQPLNNVGTITTIGNVVASTAPSSSVLTNNFTQTPDAVGNTPLRLTAANASGLLINSPSGGIASVASAGKIESTASNDVDLTTTGGDVNVNAYNQIVMNSGNDISLKADPGINPLYTAAVNLTAQNGNGGLVNITANPGQVAAFGGKINITANGGTITIPQPPPELPISVTVGGEVNITANTGAGGLYTLTSAVNIAAAGVNSYAGAIPPIGSVAGYNFIYGNAGVNICSGLPSAGFQLPLTTYIYGTGVPLSYGGVRLQSPNGIQMLSDTYMTKLYPLDTDGLTIGGRSFLGTANVFIEDVETLTAVSGSGVIKTDLLNSVGNGGIAYLDNLYPSNTTKGVFANFLKPTIATAVGAPNLVISGNANLLGNQNYVQIANADTIAFDPAATGALSGVKSINGASWPPPTGDASLWSQYPATSIVDISGYGLVNVSTINGQAYPASSTDWSLYPAQQNVDISGFALNSVGSIGITAGGTITSAGALGIFADGADLSIAADNGGNVNIGTGNLGDINITTGGTGNEITITGDVVNVDATQGIRFSNRLDMTNNNIENAASITTGIVQGGTSLAVRADNGDLNLTTANGVVNVTSPGIGVVINSGATGNTTVDAANIILTADNEIQMLGAVAVGTPAAPQTITVEGGVRATGDVLSSLGTDNYSLNTIGALVGGIPSGFRDATEFYVSFDGSDTTGLGSILSPYQTIQKAITEAELVSSSLQVCVINVASGHYTENLTFNKGYIVLNGSLQSQTGNEVCEITGSINIAVSGTSDLFNRQITFNGFNLTCGAGQAITDTSTTPHIVSFQDCKCFVVNQFFVSTGAFSDGRLYMTNVEIQQTLATSVLPVIVTNLGQIELERVDVSLSGNCSAIVIGGTSILSRFSLSALETTNTGATLLPMLNITSSTTSTHTLGNVAFAISSATTKANTSAVYIASGVNTTLLMLNNVFSLQGTSASTNFTVGYNGVGSPAILGVNNTSLNVPLLLPQTTAVQAGITQISYTDINPPVMGAYSKAADQTIAAANTPVAVVFQTTQFQQGTALATTRLQVSQSGNYQINYSLQVTNPSLSGTATTYLSKNGTAVANTGNQFSYPTNLQAHTSPQFILPLNAGDYIELFINASTTGTIINATAAAPPLPAIPGAVITITQIR